MSNSAFFEFKLAVVSNCGPGAWQVLEYMHRKHEYYRGQGRDSFYHSRQAISNSTGMSVQQVRTALAKLINAGMVTKLTRRGACGTCCWLVVEFPRDQLVAEPPAIRQPSGCDQPASWLGSTSHKYIYKSNSKCMQGMPACSSKNQKQLIDPEPEQKPWFDALDSGRIQPHSRGLLAALAIEKGATPEELKELVGQASGEAVLNPGGYLRHLLTTDALEKLRTGRMASQRAAAQGELRKNADLCRELLQALGVDGMDLGYGFDPIKGVWKLLRQEIDLKVGPYGIKEQLKALYPGINPYDRGHLISVR